MSEIFAIKKNDVANTNHYIYHINGEGHYLFTIECHKSSRNILAWFYWDISCWDTYIYLIINKVIIILQVRVYHIMLCLRKYIHRKAIGVGIIYKSCRNSWIHFTHFSQVNKTTIMWNIMREYINYDKSGISGKNLLW